MQSTVPNEDLIQHLLKTYYRNDAEQQEGGGKEFISSHWRHYGDLCEAQTDGKGHLGLLKGAAFGTCQWSGRRHQLVDQICILTHLAHLPHRRRLLELKAIAAKICDAMGLNPTLDVFRQVCSLALLERHLTRDMRCKRLNVLMIGDGYGVLSALFKELFPDSTIVMVDIGRVLLFQANYCQKAHPNYIHKLVSRDVGADSIDFMYCPAEHLAMLERFEFDIAVNIASMQEMNSSTIADYFTFLRKHLRPGNLFYCCNRESKTLVEGEVSTFLDYPWQDDDRFLMDGFCPWHRYFFARGHAKNGPHLFGARIPFVHYYDGIHRHRLAVLATHA